MFFSSRAAAKCGREATDEAALEKKITLKTKAIDRRFLVCRMAPDDPSKWRLGCFGAHNQRRIPPKSCSVRLRPASFRCHLKKPTKTASAI